MYPWETYSPNTHSHPQKQMILQIPNQFSNPYYLKYVNNLLRSLPEEKNKLDKRKGS